MKKLQEYLGKKRNELNFKKAGPGFKLSDSSNSSGQQSSSGSSSHEAPRPARNYGPDENVAKATLARLEKNNNPNKAVASNTLNDILVQERHNINQEMKIKQDLEEMRKKEALLREKESINPYKEFEDSQLFSCTALQIDSPIPFKDLMCKIKSSIFDNFADDPTLRSAMCLFNCNRTIDQNESPFKTCIEILLKIVSNLLTDDPQELQKFKRIRKAKIEQKVLSLDGALDLLFAVGFTLDDDKEWLVYAEKDDVELKKKMIYLKDLLSCPQIFPIELDRQLKYLNEKGLNSNFDSNDNNEMTSSDFKKFYSNLEKTREINEMFVSKETKTKLLSNNNKSNFKPIFTKLRFKFPVGDDLVMVEAIFYCKETLGDVRTWFLLNFAQKLPSEEFNFKIGVDVLGDELCSKTLTELNLTPSATLIVIMK